VRVAPGSRALAHPRDAVVDHGPRRAPRCGRPYPRPSSRAASPASPWASRPLSRNSSRSSRGRVGAGAVGSEEPRANPLSIRRSAGARRRPSERRRRAHCARWGIRARSRGRFEQLVAAHGRARRRDRGAARGARPDPPFCASPRRRHRPRACPESRLDFADVRWHFLREGGSAANKRIGKSYAVTRERSLLRSNNIGTKMALYSRQNRLCSGPGIFMCRFAKLRQVDWRRRGSPSDEASAPGGSRNGSTEMRS